MSKDFLLRNIPEPTLAYLQNRARDAGLSANKYIVSLLNRCAIAPEIDERENQFENVIQINMDVIRENTEMLKAIIQVLEGDEIG